MVTTFTLLVVLATVAAFALLSRRIKAWPLTLPMVFTGLGLGMSWAGLDLGTVEDIEGPIHLITEVTLILVLFSDASKVRLKALRENAAVPARMLLIGMPLVLLGGALVARWVSPDQPWALAFLLAAILTPTDAALGRSASAYPAVPERVRQGLNVESGLNDGLVLPVVIVAAVVAARSTGTDAGDAPDNVVTFALLQVVLGPLVGGTVGALGARLLDAAVARETATHVAQGLYFLAVAFASFVAAESVGGNGFIAAFVGGLAFGNVLRAPSMFIDEFMEGEGLILTMSTFFVFGAVMAPVGLEHANWKTLALAATFLTVGRMGPIWLSLAGSGLKTYERLYLGWFGARGLASVLFALVVLSQFDLPGAREVVACVVLTVLGSIVLHGLTAAPLARRFETGDRPASP